MTMAFTYIGDFIRNASATASEGRLSTEKRRPPAFISIKAKYVPSLISVITHPENFRLEGFQHVCA